MAGITRCLFLKHLMPDDYGRTAQSDHRSEKVKGKVMEFENMIKLIQTVSASELDSFCYEENGIRIKCGKKSGKTVMVHDSAENSVYCGGMNAGGDVQSKDCTDIASPLVGVFYEAPAEGEDPFVQVGDRVKKGQVLGIIEAMKLMNEIESDADGIVREIRVHNTDTVEYGQILFVIEKETIGEAAS